MKLCGCKEKCFESGEQWGHLQGVLCKHLYERDVGRNKSISKCDVDNSVVIPYSTNEEYLQLNRAMQHQK